MGLKPREYAGHFIQKMPPFSTYSKDTGSLGKALFIKKAEPTASCLGLHLGTA